MNSEIPLHPLPAAKPGFSEMTRLEEANRHARSLVFLMASALAKEPDPAFSAADRDCAAALAMSVMDAVDRCYLGAHEVVFRGPSHHAPGHAPAGRKEVA